MGTTFQSGAHQPGDMTTTGGSRRARRGARTEPDSPAAEDVPEPVDPDFDEATYLRAFPDIAEAVRRGMLISGLAHYLTAPAGRRRVWKRPQYRALLGTYAGPAAPTGQRRHADHFTLRVDADDRLERRPVRPVDRDQSGNAARHAAPTGRRFRASSRDRCGAHAGSRAGPPVRLPAGRRAGRRHRRRRDRPARGQHAGVPLRQRGRRPVAAAIRWWPATPTCATSRLAALPTAAGGEADPEVIYAILDQHVGVQIAAINRLIIEQARARRLIERFGPVQRPLSRLGDHHAARRRGSDRAAAGPGTGRRRRGPRTHRRR